MKRSDQRWNHFRNMLGGMRTCLGKEGDKKKEKCEDQNSNEVGGAKR